MMSVIADLVVQTREMMNSIQKWIQKREEAVQACVDAKKFLEIAEALTLPETLRPATFKDIRVGNVLWYKEGDDGAAFWQLIEEVHNASDDFKAYTAYNGCRCGLEGAYVEVVEEKDHYDLKDNEQDGRNL